MGLINAIWGDFSDKKKKALTRQNVSIFTMKIYKDHSVCKSQRMLKIFQEPTGFWTITNKINLVVDIAGRNDCWWLR